MFAGNLLYTAKWESLSASEITEIYIKKLFCLVSKAYWKHNSHIWLVGLPTRTQDCSTAFILVFQLPFFIRYVCKARFPLPEFTARVNGLS